MNRGNDAGSGTAERERGTGRTWESGSGEQRRFPFMRMERMEAVGGEGADRRARPVSGRERGREGCGRLGQTQRKKGAGEGWAEKAERRKRGKGEEKCFFLPFSF